MPPLAHPSAAFRDDTSADVLASPQPSFAASALPGMLTIGDIARRYSLTLRALRFYEDRGLLQPLRHGTTRFYDAEACRRLETILRGKHLGYTLTAIAAMLARGDVSAPDFFAQPNEVQAQIDRLERKRRELDAAIGELRAMHARATPGQAGPSAAHSAA